MAKRFRFRLETLLRVRRLSEREAKRKVASRQAEIARIDGLSRHTLEEISQQESELRNEQSRSKPRIAALSMGRSWIAHLQHTHLLNRQLRREREDELKTAVAELNRVRTQTRIVEKLRERRWTSYRKDRAHREQADSDDLARQLLCEFDGAPAFTPGPAPEPGTGAPAFTPGSAPAG